MEKIYLKKSYLPFSIAAIIISAADIIFGIHILIKESNMPSGDKTEGIMQAAFFILQGIIFIVWSSIYLYNRKYYIRWTENEIEMLLPGSKNIIIIPVTEIIEANVRLFEIELSLTGKTIKLDLNSLNDNDLIKIKSFIGKIKAEKEKK